jgi:hypothetical protein
MTNVIDLTKNIKHGAFIMRDERTPIEYRRDWLEHVLRDFTFAMLRANNESDLELIIKNTANIINEEA